MQLASSEFANMLGHQKAASESEFEFEFEFSNSIGERENINRLLITWSLVRATCVQVVTNKLLGTSTVD